MNALNIISQALHPSLFVPPCHSPCQEEGKLLSPCFMRTFHELHKHQKLLYLLPPQEVSRRKV